MQQKIGGSGKRPGMCATSQSFLPSANEVCEGYVFTGVCLSVHEGSPWQRPPVHRPPVDRDPPGQRLPLDRDNGNERAVRILLECILVFYFHTISRKNWPNWKVWGLWHRGSIIAWCFYFYFYLQSSYKNLKGIKTTSCLGCCSMASSLIKRKF